MTTAYIVDAVRTAGGKRGGKLTEWHPADMAGEMLNALVDRTGIDPMAIDDVILGCVNPAIDRGFQIGRGAVLASRLPESVPAVTIDRHCGSSQQAIHFAAQAILSGMQHVVIAAGVESSSPASKEASRPPAHAPENPIRKSPKQEERYPGIVFSHLTGADLMAKKYNLTRADLDAYAVESHRRAAHAADAGAFDQEIIGLRVNAPTGTLLHHHDEAIRADASCEAFAAAPILRQGGFTTAANASEICDGASAVMIVSERALRDHDLTPLVRIHALAVTAGDPVIMFEEPLFATEKALARAGLKIGDIDLFEVHETFASIPVAWLRYLHADPEKLNIHGGAIALGHPLGASGTRLMTTLIHALHRHGRKYGLQTMAEGSGLANVTIIERL